MITILNVEITDDADATGKEKKANYGLQDN